MKDNFSAQANLYAHFRPRYPAAMYDFIFTHVKDFNTALDVATGNGQVAVVLAERFKQVYATDISGKQLQQAPQKDNIIYKGEPAEASSFPDNYFNLVTVAQAIHWFDFDTFHTEVKRILKDGGLICVIGYGLLRVNNKVDLWLDNFYRNITGPYWDEERKYIDEAYATIPFPFNEIPSPALFIEYNWKKEQLTGFLNTWSAVQHFIKKNDKTPLSNEALIQLDEVWPGNVSQTVRFPLFLRTGYKI